MQALTVNVPTPVDLSLPDKDYVRIAAKLGFEIPKEPSDRALQKILADLSIGVYAYQPVLTYLKTQRPENHFVVWVPVAKGYRLDKLARRLHRMPTDGWEHGRHGCISHNLYNKPIPYPVMVTMEKIVDAAKEYKFNPMFFVSDFEERRVPLQRSTRFDPFLAVGTSDSDALFVIERWDEPGFREEVYSQKRAGKAKAKK